MKDFCLRIAFILVGLICVAPGQAQNVVIAAGSAGHAAAITVPVINRIATVPPEAPDLAHATFWAERLPITVPQGSFFWNPVVALNNKSEVLGYQIPATGGSGQLIFWSGGVRQGISGYWSEYGFVGKQLNDASQFVATAAGTSPAAMPGAAVFDASGPTVRMIGDPVTGITLSSINNAGWLLGAQPTPNRYYPYGSYFGKHFVIKNGVRIDLALPPATDGGADLYALNDQGEIIGSADTLPKFWWRALYFGTNQNPRWLPGNGAYEDAYNLNNHGQIVGLTQAAGSLWPALWDSGRADEAKILATGRTSGEYAWAADINRWGQIVGQARDGAALWIDRKLVPLRMPGDLRVTYLHKINDKGEMLGGDPRSAPTYVVHPCWIDLATDVNRDGIIKFTREDDTDQTSADRPFRFWINDDDDGNALNDEQEVVGGTNRDCDSRGEFGISSRRDLEDFARMWVSTTGITAALKSGTLQLGLKWKDGYLGTPKANLYLQYETDGRSAYLTDPIVAAGQITNPWSATLVSAAGKDTVAPGDLFIFKKALFTGLTEDQSTLHLLFEGAGIGKGQLQLVICDKDGQIVGEGPGLWLDLCSVKTMYERVTAMPDETYRPYLFSDPPPSESYFSFSVDTSDAYVKPADEAPTALIFVHGWNMSYNEYLSFSETMFKRLWWQGYRGRFCAFRWATMTSIDSYNTSEFWAWRYGQSLKGYVETPGSGLGSGLKARLPGYGISVAAHSMGNIVTGSALKRGMTLSRYFLMEAAVPSGCFNDSVNNYKLFVDREASKPTPDTTADLGYRLYLQSAVSSSHVGKIMNLYNELDFALFTGTTFPVGATNWEQNQLDYKPDDPLGVGQYHYDPTQPAGQRASLTYITGIRFITDVNESMAYVARPRSKAIGAEPNSTSVFPSINLQNYGFGRDCADHSGQFNRRIQQLNGFYKSVFDESK